MKTIKEIIDQYGLEMTDGKINLGTVNWWGNSDIAAFERLSSLSVPKTLVETQIRRCFYKTSFEVYDGQTKAVVFFCADSSD